MPVEILASAVVSSFIAPVAKKGLEALVEQVGEALGGSVAEQFGAKARTVWSKIRERFSSGSDQAVLEDLETAPDDEEARQLFERRLRAKLTEDEELRSELEEVMKTLQTAAQSAGAQASHSGTGDINQVDLRDSDFSHAKQPMIGAQQTVHHHGPAERRTADDASPKSDSD